MLELKIEKLTKVETPRKAFPTDAGIDFYVPNSIKYVQKNGKNINIDLDKEGKHAIVIYPNESCLIPMGIKLEFNKNYALVFFNRSGIATKKHLLRGACIVDSSYRGELFLNLNNVSKETQYIYPNDKIIQGLLLPVPEVKIKKGKVNIETDRGEGGFGSTDKK